MFCVDLTLFGKIEDRDRWIKENSVVVDSKIMTLANGGIVDKVG